MVKLAKGVVLHQRRKPFKHGLKFTNYMWFVDLRKPQEKLLPKDHFGGEAPSLLAAITSFVTSRGEVIDASDKLYAIASARTNGYVFNPLSVYWCIKESGEVRWAILEIHNTYGDRHAHLLHPDQKGNATIDKEFYVSPFFTIDGEYKTRTFFDEKHIVLSINLYQNSAQVFSASFTGELLEASIKNRVLAYLRTPLATLQAMARIRAHGIWLWLRRLPVIPRPNHPKQSGML
ncbi:MAG: DUF1365 domain-containing protein [Candidatus Nanopelagicaceae bacterium]